ncbi:long-chain fatty acid--CoA ligase [Corynebacterium glyciniphilum]|uniref:AMP-dependent synthetase/ligase n=1 Tax=Corynebacterium glyciniphilum TaxID=1404244 RepID=UPI00264EDEB3|nr:long-chain fatty acid--CoA ligase [Corynebacterium glyciniphilum]MDN5682242.1 long-chain fatty acid--CoA ligase [Corynebacterium glyciniphilum]MDN6705500.1 long-chain fatty acid--CoA ligase [Corynebacterium glyciniphilum]
MTTASAGSPPFTTVPIDPSIQSVGHMLRKRIKETPDRRAYSYPVADGASGETWEAVTWAELGSQASEVAGGLMSLGIEAEERVAIASSTRYEWALANYGIMYASAATVTVYPTTVADDVAFILDDSGSRVMFAEDRDQVDKLLGLRDEIPGVQTVVLVSGDVPDAVENSAPGWVITLEELRRRGREHLDAHPSAVDDRIDATRLEHLSTLIYTSGTTGRPKGVRLPHRVWVFEAHASEITSNSGPEKLLTIDDKQFLWLPLAHVMGKLLLVLPLHVGYETAIDGRIDKIIGNLAVVKPTFMGSAPRIFEKAYNGIATMMATDGGIKEKLFHWASRVGIQVFDADNGVGSASAWVRLQAKIGDRLVMSKIRERFGGNVKYFISGSAAMNTDIARWFGAAGMPILEGYGLTETSAATCLSRPYIYRAGYVGRPLEGIEVRIAEDGEVLVKGPGVMDGYHNNREATAEVLEPDGWFHTGDIGEMDSEGRVKITDRKKELFKTSNGKYVAPAQVEAKFKGLCPVASQLVVVGNDRPFVSALVTLDEDAVTAWAERQGVSGGYREIVRAPETREMVQGYIDELNSHLNRWEQVKKFTILHRDLGVDYQEITPSLKLRRKVIHEHFAQEIASHYE